MPYLLKLSQPLIRGKLKLKKSSFKMPYHRLLKTSRFSQRKLRRNLKRMIRNLLKTRRSWPTLLTSLHQSKSMGIHVHCALIRRGSTMQRACVTTATILKEGSKMRRYANIPIENHMLEECAIVAIKLKNGRNKAALKSN